MASKTVPVRSSLAGQEVVTEIRVQGFRRGAITGADPVVVVALTDERGTIYGTAELTLENANILGEYLRSEAEWAVGDRVM